MINEERLASLRPYLQYSPEMVELCETVEKLWRVARAAHEHICSSRDGYPDPDEKLNAAMDALHEGEGKA